MGLHCTLNPMGYSGRRDRDYTKPWTPKVAFLRNAHLAMAVVVRSRGSGRNACKLRVIASLK